MKNCFELFFREVPFTTIGKAPFGGEAVADIVDVEVGEHFVIRHVPNGFFRPVGYFCQQTGEVDQACRRGAFFEGSPPAVGMMRVEALATSSDSSLMCRIASNACSGARE